MQTPIRPIAFHLPQFHPFKENDEWWGKGFTEWTNVTKAQPLFQGHYQPHLPTELGFYDLRLEEARLAQIELAKQHGIYGFCYYHYWFSGKRLMNQPLDRMLANQKEDFPFMLCWANENWTKKWDGQENEILLKQDYSDLDHQSHAEFVCNTFFKDNRYITVNDKPVFLFYKAYLIPNLKEALVIWRNQARTSGLKGLYLLCMDNFLDKPAEDFGFDAAVHFHPDYRYFSKSKIPLHDKIMNKLKLKQSVYYNHHIEDYQTYFIRVLNEDLHESKLVYPGITPMWDNTARMETGGLIYKNSTPKLYGEMLQALLEKFKPKTDQENFFFINAWNEWAEGNHLEPCIKYGMAYLRETKSVFEKYK